MDTDSAIGSLAEPVALTMAVGLGAARREIAVLDRGGRAPGLLWLGGFGSDMRGTKASALDALAAAAGLRMVRFDYSGHGASAGRFEEGTVSRWLEEALAVFERAAPGPNILVGSSMGGWLALLLAARVRARGSVAGLVLIAPAIDMTRDLIWDHMDEAARAALVASGRWQSPNGGAVITRALIEDGDRHLFGDRLIDVGCPVAILQGVADGEVPWRHAERLVSHLASDDVVLTLIQDGDHRLSRPQDLAVLTAAVTRMADDWQTGARAAQQRAGNN